MQKDLANLELLNSFYVVYVTIRYFLSALTKFSLPPIKIIVSSLSA